MDLSIHADKHRMRITNYSQKSVTALEKIYSSILDTSSHRKDFKTLKSLENLKLDENAKYFQAFSINFKAFSEVYKSISDAYRCLEDHAIYIDDETYISTLKTIKLIQSCYNQYHTVFQKSHDDAQLLFKEKKLNSQTKPLNIDIFINNFHKELSSLTAQARFQFRNNIRNLLNPNKN